MKLRDYLKQFEGLDPEMEVFQQHWSTSQFAKISNQKVKIELITQEKESRFLDLFRVNFNTDSTSFKAIILY